MAAKTIRTKPFLLATAGSTVDNRKIEDKDIKDMASSFNVKTYGSRVNIEHIRGITPGEPFNCYGDIVELSTGEVEVDFNGKTEKRLALYGVFDMHDSAKKLNDAGQKVYPSIEIQPDFGGKGFAYCMGVALTDSPAAIATERMHFNRTDPSRLNLSSDQAALLEFVESAAEPNPAMDGFFSKLGDLLKPFAKTAPAVTEPAKIEPAQTGTFDMAAFTALIEGMAKQFDSTVSAIQLASTMQLEVVQAEVTALSAKIDTTAAPGHTPRPAATGTDAQFSRTDC